MPRSRSTPEEALTYHAEPQPTQLLSTTRASANDIPNMALLAASDIGRVAR